ncbi:MAG: helix-turn-helix domain-containing protein [Vicinamibacterales bacterium]
MTIREVADALKVAEKTVYAMASEGEIPAFRVRSQWRIRRVDFEAWLAKQLGHEPTGAAQTSQSSPADERREVAEKNDSQSAIPESGGHIDDSWERLPQEELQHRLVSALGASVVKVHSQMDAKPFEIDLAPPLPHRVRIYLYNATRPPGGRPLGEHKIQLIVPGKGRGERASFNNDGGRIVLLMGYAADEDVFILWDAGLYSEFAWSRNVQVKAETIIEASAGKLATQERQLRPATGKATVETVLAVKSRRLAEAIIRRMELTRERLLKD